MGIRRALHLVDGSTAVRSPTPVRTVHQGPSHLEQLTFEDWFGASVGISRDVAMTVPAVHRARGLVCSTIAALPLRAYRGEVLLDDLDQPPWTYRTDSPDPYGSPYQRTLWTVDDLLFYGVAVWALTRGADGFPLDAWRIDPSRYTWTGDQLLIDGVEVKDPSTVIVIPGPDEGLTVTAAATLRTAARLERAAARHAGNPVPSIELHQELDVALDDEEIDEMLAAWTAARDSETGGVAFTSYGVKANVLGQIESQLLIEGRNASAVDVGRHVGIPAAMLDATTAGASLTYETTAGRNQQFLDYGISAFTGALAARLSMDDVVPRGQRIAVDTSTLTDPTGTPAGGPPTQD